MNVYRRLVERFVLAPRERALVAEQPFANAYPRGWFAVCLRHELATGAVLSRVVLGQQLRVSLHRGDRPRVLAPDGRSLPTQLYHGVVLVWHGAPDPFALPVLPREGFTPFTFQYFWRPVVTNVKEITEDIADLHHFGAGAHHYDDVVVHRFDPTGPTCFLDLGFTRDDARLEAHFEAVGVGFFVADLVDADHDLRTQLLICYTPTSSPNRIQLVTAESHLRLRHPHKLNPLLRLVPRRFVDRLVSAQAMRAIRKDVAEHDVAHWESVAYLARRRESSNEMLQRYRAWVEQFYPRAKEST